MLERKGQGKLLRANRYGQISTGKSLRANYYGKIITDKSLRANHYVIALVCDIYISSAEYRDCPPPTHRVI